MAKASVVLRSLKRVVEPELEVVAMCDNAVSIVDSVDSLEPDLVILEVSWGELGGVQRLMDRFPEMKLIALCDDASVARSIVEKLAGPSIGVVWKLDAPEDTLPAARAVLRGKSYESPTIREGS